MYYGIYRYGKLIKTFDNKNDFQEFWNYKTNRVYNSSLQSMISRDKTYTVNGYRYCTNEYNIFLDEIEYKRSTHHKIKEYKYNDIIYAFDIETSTFSVDDKKLSIMYLAGFKGIKVLPDVINTDNYTEYTTDYIVCRDWNDVDNVLYKLNNKKIVTIIYIHNMSYEFSFFQNSKFICEFFDNENLMAVNNRQPFKLRCGNIEFRCSYKLTGLSLSTLGNELNLSKLTDVKGGYEQKYTPVSKLPQSEYIYNERDLDVTLLSVLNELNKSSAYHNINDIKTLLTLTGLTRAENKCLSSKEIQTNYATFCRSQVKDYNKILGDKYYFEFLEDAFIGGYTRANRNFQFIPVDNVASVDISSSYPTQMLNHKFPIDFIICEDNKLNTLNKLINVNTEYINKKKISNSDKVIERNAIENWYFKSISNMFPYYFIADVTLRNINLKTFNNSNEIPIISISKLHKDNILKNADTFKSDNGRLIYADKVSLTVTNIDLLIYSLCYDFELTDCNTLIYTNKKQRLNKYVLNSVVFFGEQKRIFKKLYNSNIELITTKDFYSNMLNKTIIDEHDLDYFFNCNLDDKKTFLKNKLRLAKSRLNAQYGINVQKVNPDKICYDIINNVWYHENSVFDTQQKLLRNYIDGIYITAYARLHLIIMSLMIIKYSNSTILYWDTDSIKFFNDTNNALKLCDTFNNCLSIGWHIYRYFNMGKFDYEGSYQFFATGGAKSYITLKDNTIEVTISGVNKKETSKYYQKLFEDIGNDFNMLCKYYYHPNVVITSDITNKLGCGYYHGDDNFFDCVVYDDNNNSYNFCGYSGVILLPSDFTISGIKNLKDAVKYIKLCKQVDRKILDKITILGKPANENYLLYREMIINNMEEY